MKTKRILMTLTMAGSLLLGGGLAGCKQRPVPRTATEEQADGQLAGKVKAAFAESPAFKFPDVQVASFKGNVQLSGFVVSEDQKSAAEAIAKDIPGVVAVKNGISLKP